VFRQQANGFLRRCLTVARAAHAVSKCGDKAAVLLPDGEGIIRGYLGWLGLSETGVVEFHAKTASLV
jgi:hypothetical protein